jgi:hypothetical protein
MWECREKRNYDDVDEQEDGKQRSHSCVCERKKKRDRETDKERYWGIMGNMLF